MSRPLQTSDIIFPVLSSNFSETLSSLKRSALSIANRLRSIAQDADFACAVGEAFDLPLVANERCGSWYIPPGRKGGSAYFKSTDGHMNEWSFSLRRLNTQVLDVVGKHDGCVIVDSTRRGKNMPDALSKTVPIWCAVLNRVLFPEVPKAHKLYTPPHVVSPSEHSQIEARMDGFVKQLQDLGLSTSDLRAKLHKPLRPLWVTRDSGIPDSIPQLDGFHPVVLCTTSRRVRGGEASEGGYIQGAGDDSESWACGLTPPVFWLHKEQLLRTSEDELPDLIAALVAAGSRPADGAGCTLIRPTSGLHVGPLDAIDENTSDRYEGVITCGEKPIQSLRANLKDRYLHLQCGPGKLGSRDLRKELSKLEPFITSHPPFTTLLICCPTGKDLSLGVALAVICLFADDHGTLTNQPTPSAIDKSSIRRRLAWITTSLPTANPSRATLQSINLHLIRPSLNTTPNPPDPPPPNPPSPTPTTSLYHSLTTHPWTLSRTLTSHLPSHPSGTFIGAASFTPPTPTSPTSNELASTYHEHGTFTTSTTQPSLSFPAQRRYIYRCDPATGRMRVFFAPGDENAGALFVELVEVRGSEQGVKEGDEGIKENERVFVGKETHLCGQDRYEARFVFGVDAEGREVRWWENRFVVRGPGKDYVSLGRYGRG